MAGAFIRSGRKHTLTNLHKHDDGHEQHSGRHDHDHAHGTGGHHHPAPTDFSGRFVLAIVLNIVFVLVEFGYGLSANSTALLADAGHNLSDVLGLLLAWGASVLGKSQPAGRFTYGLRSSSILAAMGNAMLLLFACGAIVWEAVHRIVAPPEVAGITVMIVAGIGIVINGLSALLFMSGSKHDLNVRGAFLHMATDALVSLGVVISGAIIFFTHWNWLDPLISLTVVAIIMIGTWGLLRDSVKMSLNAVPAQIELIAVEDFLKSQPGVTDVTDLHIWSMSTTENALTAQLLMPFGAPADAFLDDLSQQLDTRFSIHHSTLQVRQSASANVCSLVRAAPPDAH